MEIKVQIDKPKEGFLTKLSAVFFGIFLSSLIFAIFTKMAGTLGIWLALGLCAILIFAGFYFIDKKSIFRIITWSLLITIIIGTVGFFIGLQVLEKNLGVLVE